MSALILMSLALWLPAAMDDLVPAALDALIEQPEDPFFFGVPNLADGNPFFTIMGTGSARCVVDLGDVTGDGASDVAVGFAPGSIAHTLRVRDGKTGALLWAHTPDGGGFRTLNGLSARDGQLALGVSSVHARVACLDGATGATVWRVDLRPGGGPEPVNVLFVRYVDDLDDDAAPDVLVGAGEGLDLLRLLSGSDGSTIWSRALGGPVYAACPTPDLDGDSIVDIYATGGEAEPFLAALSGADGSTIWSVPLAGPGAALLLLEDLQGDGTEDLAVGLFAEPADCLLAIDGSNGAQIWAAASMMRNVTSLAPLGDVDGDGLDDFTAGSFDNAVPCVSASNGLLLWRREISTNNTGALLSVATAGDLDGNGDVDVYAASMDHVAYVFDGEKGFLLTTHDTHARGIAVAALADSDGDGRAEFAIAGQGALNVLAGDSGIAAGPIVFINFPANPLAQMTVKVYAHPGKALMVFGALSPGFVPLPGYGGAFGLNPAAFAPIHVGNAPAAGESGYVVGPFPRELLDFNMYFQAVTIYEPGHGLLSNVLVYDPVP